MSRQSNRGLVNTAPISATKALRLLEAAYAKQGAQLDRANKELARLRKLVKEHDVQKHENVRS